MSGDILVLAATAAALGLTHTLIGPDHYLPFIVLSKARKWSAPKTAFITFLCGVGHILGSVVLGFAGIALGVAVFKLQAIEAFRGEVAAWLLILFGFTYSIWGIHRAVRNRPHEHVHTHGEREPHSHPHTHSEGHVHVHDSGTRSLTPWVLFTIFVFGPCEPLIPLLMYPAAAHDMRGVFTVASFFGVATIGTMLAIVMASFFGLSRLPAHRLERYSHALAGLAIFLSGGAIKLLGL